MTNNDDKVLVRRVRDRLSRTEFHETRVGLMEARDAEVAALNRTIATAYPEGTNVIRVARADHDRISPLHLLVVDELDKFAGPDWQEKSGQKFQADARVIASHLAATLPLGTFDRLVAELLLIKASHLRTTGQ